LNDFRDEKSTMSDGGVEKPLAGTRILDLTRLLPGGYCTLLLADMGADVVKVEEPGKGDYIRWTPPMVGEESTAHRALNRGKRSITLNLKTSEGVDVLKRLASEADVLVESFRPGVMDRLGVGWSALREVNRSLVYCAITGYGQDGPYRDRAGHDINYIGYAGVLGIIGPRDGAPVVPGVQIGDIGGGGMAGAIGILAALLKARSTGVGSFVDTSMLDGVVSWLTIHGGDFLATGQLSKRGEMRLSGAFPCYRVYRAGDGKYLTVGALEPQFWRALCEATGVPEMIEEQFSGDAAAHEKMESVFASRSRDEWLEALASLETCVGPVNDLDEAFRDPQVVHRKLVAEVDGERYGPSSPMRFDGEQLVNLSRAPGFGEHTAEVLAEVGVDEDELEKLRAAGAV
jgi:crotonobetainyl-CoA:carnitine CoA-transferase CaiB-like acyl-CoA transferase